MTFSLSKMKSLKEVENLIAQWESDPCWDLEDTEGFEHYRDYLLGVRRNRESQWKKARVQELFERSEELGCSVQLVQYIEILEKRLEDLERRIGA